MALEKNSLKVLTGSNTAIINITLKLVVSNLMKKYKVVNPQWKK